MWAKAFVEQLDAAVPDVKETCHTALNKVTPKQQEQECSDQVGRMNKACALHKAHHACIVQCLGSRRGKFKPLLQQIGIGVARGMRDAVHLTMAC